MDKLFVLNPKTNRMIKRNGTLHKKLIKEGLLDKVNMLKPTEICDIPPEASDREIELLKREANLNLPKHSHAVRGRGRHKGKLVVRRREQPAEYYRDIIENAATDQQVSPPLELKRSVSIDRRQPSDPIDIPKTPPKLVRQRGKFYLDSGILDEISSDSESESESESSDSDSDSD